MIVEDVADFVALPDVSGLFWMKIGCRNFLVLLLVVVDDCKEEIFILNRQDLSSLRLYLNL